jgi:hypothetical protein
MVKEKNDHDRRRAIAGDIRSGWEATIADGSTSEVNCEGSGVDSRAGMARKTSAACCPERLYIGAYSRSVCSVVNL